MTVQEANSQRLLQKLKRHTSKMYGYEMGLSEIELCKKALEKQIPKKPNMEQKGLLGVKMWHCPVCNKEIISDWNKDSANNYCHHCGQKIDWKEGGTSD